MNKVILVFDGPYSFLSNFSTSYVKLDDEMFPTVENAFQAAKTLDPAQRFIFKNCAPNFAKTEGRKLMLRTDWDDSKVEIMQQLLKQKFVPGSKMAESLIATGDAYICEGNYWHDNFWGACTCKRCLYTAHLNTLGIMLMQIRDELGKV